MECLSFVAYMTLYILTKNVPVLYIPYTRNSIGKSLMLLQNDDYMLLRNHILDAFVLWAVDGLFRIYSQRGISIRCNPHRLGLFGFGDCFVSEFWNDKVRPFIIGRI